MWTLPFASQLKLLTSSGKRPDRRAAMLHGWAHGTWPNLGVISEQHHQMCMIVCDAVSYTCRHRLWSAASCMFTIKSGQFHH